MKRLLLLTSLCLVALLMFAPVALAQSSSAMSSSSASASSSATASSSASASASATASASASASASVLPTTGGISGGAVLSLGAGALLLGSGLVSFGVLRRS